MTGTWLRLGVGGCDRNGRFQQTVVISTTKQYNIDTNTNNDGGRNRSPVRLHQYYLSSKKKQRFFSFFTILQIHNSRSKFFKFV